MKMIFGQTSSLPGLHAITGIPRHRRVAPRSSPFAAPALKPTTILLRSPHSMPSRFAVAEHVPTKPSVFTAR